MKLIHGNIVDQEFDCINEIAGEIANILFNTTYYEHGKLISKPRPKHNAYMINGVKYEIIPNIILVILPSIEPTIYQSKLYNKLNCRYGKFIENVRLKWGAVIEKSSTAGTAQYMVFNTNKQFTVQCELLTNLKHINKRKDKDPYIIYVYEGSIPVSGLSKSNINSIYSLSSIVVSINNEFKLPNRYISPDFPHYTDYQNSDKIIPKRICYNVNIGLHGELHKHFKCIHYTTSFPVNFTIDDIKLVKFEWLTIYSSNFEDLTPIQLIKGGMFDEAPAEIIEYKCFMTGCPIFEDCYVFDFYSINLTASPQRLDDVSASSKKTYNTPRCVLVSPYYFHLVSDNVNDFNNFKRECGAAFLIYRTKCPTTFSDVIERGKIHPNVKTLFLDLYNNAVFQFHTVSCKKSIIHNIANDEALTSRYICDITKKIIGYFN